MTHLLDARRQDQTLVLDFQGLLDPEAFAPLEAAVGIANANGSPVRVVLRAGTEVDRAVLPQLGALDAEVVAEAPYLARWIAEARRR